ncbi:threonine synthase [Candidatus Woesearchaeota archaeon]|nr:threonine synthase [Candidatus Woesearchaeota archaeon]
MPKILYRSTNRNSGLVDFKDALFKGQAPDYGLYMPTFIPRLTGKEIESFNGKGYSEIAFYVAKEFLQDCIGGRDLRLLINQAYNFRVPIEKIENNLHVMRLDRGPTASFKDFAARLMAGLMHHFSKKEGRKLTVLVSTSGDTGGAVADAFSGLDNVNVIILFPFRGVSPVQRMQMTTLGKNVRTLAVKGDFDDCQALVKQAFNDRELEEFGLTSANSINFGRLLPQVFYYFYAYSKFGRGNAVFSVPSGNFGNLMGGVIAREMGLPVEKFVVSVNENYEFPRFLSSGIYKPIEPSKKCSSNSMNIGHPSNLARLIDLYGGWLYDKRSGSGKIIKKGILKQKPDMKMMRKDFASFSITDKDASETIKKFYSKYKSLLEPHGAVAWCGLEKYQKNSKIGLGISLETANPAKFPDEIRNILGIQPKIPKSLKGLGKKQEKFEVIGTDYKDFKCRLMELNS